MPADTDVPGAARAAELAAQTLAEAKALTVESAEDLATATELLNDITRRQKEVDAERVTVNQPHLDAGRRVDDAFRGPQQDLDLAKTVTKNQIRVYQDRLERERRAEEQRLRELAEKERRELEALSQVAEEEGLEETAEELRREADSIAAPIVPSRVQRTEGLAMREEWRFEIVDASKLPRQFLIPNEQAIRAHVKSMKGQAQIPGVRIWSDKQPVANGRGYR